MPTLHILQGAVRAAFAFTGTPTLAEALCQAGFAIETPCGGRGTCRKCAVQALAGAVSPPADAEVRERWEDITPLARNEWICWVQSVKKAETRAQHVERVGADLKAGKRRPCCWPGCSHREKTGLA